MDALSPFPKFERTAADGAAFLRYFETGDETTHRKIIENRC